VWMHVPSPSCPSAPASECSTLDSEQLSLLERFATSSGKHSPPPSWSRLWKAASWIRRLSGLTSAPSTLARGAAEWIASLPACPASPTAQPASRKATKTAGAGATVTAPSPTPSESSTSVAPPWSGSRTSQPGLWGDSFDLSAKHYADWVTSSKDLSSALRRTLALRMSVSACSSWPTTTAGDSVSTGSADYSTESGRHSGTTLTDAIRTWKTPHGMAGIDHTGKAGGGGEFAAQAERWQTPNAQLFNSRRQVGGEERQDLLGGQAAKWMTPNVPNGGRSTDHAELVGQTLYHGDKKVQLGLESQSRNWPSPMARDHKGGGRDDTEEGRKEPHGHAGLAGGSLFAPGPLDPRWPRIVADYPHLAPATEPGVRGVADGFAWLVDESRRHQLRAIGNGAVPLCFAVAARTLARRAVERAGGGVNKEYRQGGG
jgi:site-specific DNA-cytosine methylase